MIFCQTQKGTVSAAEQIVNDFRERELIRDNNQLMRLIEGSKAVSDKSLQKLVMSGVGFHNAQLSPQDKNIVEDLFFQGDLIVQKL